MRDRNQVRQAAARRAAHARRRIELRQSVEGLIGIAVLRPVLAQLAEVLIEGAVLLGQNDDVTETAEAGAAVDCFFGTDDCAQVVAARSAELPTMSSDLRFHITDMRSGLPN